MPSSLGSQRHYGGLIFVPTSPRAVNDAQAKAVIAAAPLQYVGVFRNAPLKEVVARAQALVLAAVQLHGDEDQAYIDALRDALADNVRIWKALSVGETFPARTLHHGDGAPARQRLWRCAQRFDWSSGCRPGSAQRHAGGRPRRR